ncbi:hypothetical protein QE152_g40963 [Popillia japonica]|uniref:Uncharacterized protein n=1 Tax=Popillia japonica TaxID=7064 RepID=A0AAW1HEZ1_POPJA
MNRRKAYENRVKRSDNKSKCIWSICNEITGRTNRSSECQIPGIPEQFSSNYNMYLLETVPNLIQLRPYNHIHSGNILVNNIASLYLHPVKTDELLELARKLNNKHSFGYDEIPTSLAKRSVEVITKVLCHIINNSLKYGIFPERLKLAIVKPLYKKGNPKETLPNVVSK